jgi:hypothetical protein
MTEEQRDIRTGLIITAMLVLLMCGLFLGMQLQKRLDTEAGQIAGRGK